MASLSPFENIMGHRLAAHLLRRSTYRATRNRIDEWADFTPQQALDQLLIPSAPTIAEPLDPVTGQIWISNYAVPDTPNQALRTAVKAWWLNEARQDNTITHKMMLFLHNCFTAGTSTGSSAEFFDYLALLRYHALGNIKHLAYRVSLDNLMLDYLDNAQNNANNPNQNYARELLELFTIGKGPQIGEGNYTNYTEQDIIQAARVLTGFKKGNRQTDIDPVTNIPRGRAVIFQHDTGDKTFTAAFQNTTIQGAANVTDMYQELQDMIELIFAQNETAKYICRRLYRFFVSKKINDEIENDIIAPLADTLRNNDYELIPVLRQLLNSSHFFDRDDSDTADEIIGSLIKSPVELALNTFNYFDLTIPTQFQLQFGFYNRSVMQTLFVRSGMDIFNPPDVAGYPAYYQTPEYNRSWFNSSTIIARYKFPQMILTNQRVLDSGIFGTQLDTVSFVSNPNNVTTPENSEALVGQLLTYMLCETVDDSRFQYFHNTVFLSGTTAEDWAMEWQQYLLTGNDDEVRIPLNNLIQAIMYAPEYQVF